MTSAPSFYIPILLGTTRRGRQSAKVAKFVYARMQRIARVETELLDLLEYDFPMMEERLRFATIRRYVFKNSRARLRAPMRS